MNRLWADSVDSVDLVMSNPWIFQSINLFIHDQQPWRCVTSRLRSSLCRLLPRIPASKLCQPPASNIIKLPWGRRFSSVTVKTAGFATFECRLSCVCVRGCGWCRAVHSHCQVDGLDLPSLALLFLRFQKPIAADWHFLNASLLLPVPLWPLVFCLSLTERWSIRYELSADNMGRSRRRFVAGRTHLLKTPFAALL